MLYQIVTFLLDVASSLLAGACLLRLYMQWQRISFANPVGKLVFALTDWLILPLRRVIAPVGRWDLSSLVAATLLQLGQYLFLWLLFNSAMSWIWVPWLAFFGLWRTVLNGLIAIVIVSAILSWFPTRSPLADVMGRLCEPLLRPLRRIVPQVGGLDLTPLVALVLLQVAMMVLGHMQAAGLSLAW